MDTLTGVINVYKEKGYTSHDVVSIVRKIFNRVKTGHTGTLDPIAEGVLPVCIGKATKIAGLIQNGDKEYEAVMRLGLTTDTEDITGKVLHKKSVNVDEDTLNMAVSSFYGKQMQTPPMYSAVKIDGKKLYKSARAGVEIERPQRQIMVYEILLKEFSGEHAKITVKCGKGAYIRTLIKDIGEKLGCGACMEELVRINSGCFNVSDSIRLNELKALANEGRLNEAITPIEKILNFPKIKVIEEADKQLKNGNKISAELIDMALIEENKKYLVYNSFNELCGIHIAVGNGKECVLKPEIILV